MISLNTPKEPYELELPYGITVTVKPLTSAGMAACQSAARRRIESLEAQHRERKESGLRVDDLPDLDDEAERDGLYHGLLVHELAARHIVSWSGVLDADGQSEAPVTREAIAAVMDLYPVGERFFQEFTLKQVLLNRIRALCRWHFRPGGGPGYCQGCRDDDSTCARGGVGLNGQHCAYHQHAPETPEEHQAWEIVQAVQNQITPRISAFDLGLALELARARDYDLGAMSELLPAAQAGVLEASNGYAD